MFRSIIPNAVGQQTILLACLGALGFVASTLTRNERALFIVGDTAAAFTATAQLPPNDAPGPRAGGGGDGGGGGNDDRGGPRRPSLVRGDTPGGTAYVATPGVTDGGIGGVPGADQLAALGPGGGPIGIGGPGSGGGGGSPGPGNGGGPVGPGLPGGGIGSVPRPGELPTTPTVPTTPTAPAVPEPEAWVLLMVGLGLVGGQLRRARASAGRLAEDQLTVPQLNRPEHR